MFLKLKVSTYSALSLTITLIGSVNKWSRYFLPSISTKLSCRFLQKLREKK